MKVTEHRIRGMASLALIAALGALAAASAAQAPVPKSPASSCCIPTTADFSKVGGDYGNQNYSALDQIATANIAQLGAVWHTHLEGGINPQDQQNNVIVLNGVIYAETTQGNVYAVDGANGHIDWSYKSGFGNQLRRGLAVGGGKVFAAFAGSRMAALDQASGRRLWTKTLTCAAPASTPPPGAARVGGFGGRGGRGGGFRSSCGSIKAPLTYYDGLVYVDAGADSERGRVLALHADTGAIAWQFWGTPGPGQFGHDTWGSGDAWQHGGATPWMSPAIDPQLGLGYWTFGNARGVDGPTNGADRPGTNLFADSLVALNLKTGKLVWYFQSVHHDIWDLDNVMAPVLADIRINGALRHVIIYSSKTGMYYELDRATGTPALPIVETPVPQSAAQHTWPTQPFPQGDAIAPHCMDGELPATIAPPGYVTGCIFTPQTGDTPVVSVPGDGGGMTDNLISFDPQTQRLYTSYSVVATVRDQMDHGVGFRPVGENRSGGIAAFNPANHRVVWRKLMPWDLSHGNGILSTAGGVMFIGQPDGWLLGLDVRDGRTLWRWQTGAGVHTSPAAYEIGGKEYITVFAGGNGLPYNSPRGDDLWGFALGGTVAQAPTPPPPSHRQPVTAAAVEGATVHNTVEIARLWFGGQSYPGESDSATAMSPDNLHVPVGTRVTFTNPAGNTKPHCVVQFYEGLFNSGPLQPGQSFSYTFSRPGEYFYNDCTDPRITGKVVVGTPAAPSAAPAG